MTSSSLLLLAVSLARVRSQFEPLRRQPQGRSSAAHTSPRCNSLDLCQNPPPVSLLRAHLMNELISLLAIEPFDWRSIGTCLFCGAIIGVERQLRGKPMGIRTSALIVLATYIFVALSLHLNADNVDPTRVIGQVVTGVGFLGAG